MINVFIDETSDSKFTDYFGLCAAVVNHTFYGHIKREFQRILLEGGWDPDVEFKGSYLFSASKGCTDIAVDKRVELAEAIVDLNVANKNARMKFAYVRTTTDDEKSDYLAFLPQLLKRVLQKPSKGQGKDLATVHCDERTDISPDEIREAVVPALHEKGYTLFEDVLQVSSNFDTVGIAYADLVGYLMARIDTIANDSELFENIPPDQFETNGKIRKLRSSISIMQKVKNLSRYEVVAELP